MVNSEKFSCSLRSFLYQTTQNMPSQDQGIKLTSLWKSTCRLILLEKSIWRPPIHHHNPLIIPRSKDNIDFFLENPRVYPHSYIGEICRLQIREREAWKPLKGWIRSISINLEFFFDFLATELYSLKKASEVFLFQKQAQRTWKPAYTYY